MATLTAVQDYSPRRDGGGHQERYYATGAANDVSVLYSAAVAAGTRARLMYASVHYSAAPTHAGVTFYIDRAHASGIGSGYTTKRGASVANAQDAVDEPQTSICIYTGDRIRIDAPAGGAGITAAIIIALDVEAF